MFEWALFRQSNLLIERWKSGRNAVTGWSINAKVALRHGERTAVPPPPFEVPFQGGLVRGAAACKTAGHRKPACLPIEAALQSQTGCVTPHCQRSPLVNPIHG